MHILSVAFYVFIYMKDIPIISRITFYGWYFILLTAFIIGIAVCCSCSSMIENSYVSTRIVNLPDNMRLVNVKIERDSSLQVFMESMDSNYQAKTKVIQNVSKYGIIKNKVIFKESKQGSHP